ncbi:MAG: precorrin-6y C5,15-methyltransferase (decarboxylating) subunit CbiE [Thermoleophilia bacterium]
MAETGESKHRLYIVGAGSGRPSELTGAADAVISSCRCFVGGKRLLALVPEGTEQHVIKHDLAAARDFIAARLEEEDVCVLTSGDPGCFSILASLKDDFAGHIEVLPGISAVQLLAARLAQAWDNWQLISFHGRPQPAGSLTLSRSTVFYCDAKNSPRELAGRLAPGGAGASVAVGSNLGGSEERLWQGSLAEAVEIDFPGNSLLLVQPSADRPVTAAVPGIADDLWLRQEGVPLSKSEVRAVLLSKARPGGRSVIWDVGSGSGSYAIECALLEPRARVIAIDRKPEACELIALNAARFGAALETVCGDAPDCFEGLPRPDLAIIGGNDGRLEQIFGGTLERLRPGGRLAVTALLEATRKAAHTLFAGSGLGERQATRVAIARGKATEWEEHNPVIIFTGDKDSEGDDDR